MQEKLINSTEDLIRQLNELPNNYIFRGHANADWLLQSSLERVVGAEWNTGAASKFEEFSLTEFQSKFHLYDKENIEPASKLAWLSIMQHYGVPTRLVDFTSSPYVALYFALESYNPLDGSDMAVFALDYCSIMERSIQAIAMKDNDFHETRASLHLKQDRVFETIVDRFSYDIAWVTEPRQLNTRLDRQAGSFLLSGNRAMKIADVLASPVYEDVPMVKYRVDRSLYTGVFALLRKMNITSKSLYGDLDGLARSIRMSMQVYSV
jgi:hypothetical protein